MQKDAESKSGPRRGRDGAALATAAVLSIACGVFGPPASAQGSTAYRCGNTYSDQPCAGGQRLKVDDARSDEDRRAADAATRRNEARADQLERSRLALERDAYERDQRAARETRQAALAERRLAASERLADARERKLALEPRGSSARFGGGVPAGKQASSPDGGRKKKRRPPSGSGVR
jgi:hypothetical protein